MKVARPWVAALTAVGVAMFASPATAATDSNTYRVSGLPSYITSPTEFSIDADGPDAVCAMRFGDVTLTAPPWRFVADPPEDGEDRDEIEVLPCNGTPDFVPVTISKPVVFRTGILFPDAIRETDLRITNNMSTPVTLALLSPTGETLAAYTVPGGRDESERETLHVPPVVFDEVGHTATFLLKAVGEGGMLETAPLVIAKGWTLFPDADGRASTRIAPCSTVTWNYDASRQPRKARMFRRDVVGAFNRLAKVTGLRFVQVPRVRRDAVIRIDWSHLGVEGPSGLGGTDGHVSFNADDGWPTDLYAGFSALHGTPADRGWLIVHELMHVLGFDHVPGRSSIMTPINYGQHRFSDGDLEGLRTIYPKAGCSSGL